MKSVRAVTIPCCSEDLNAMSTTAAALMTWDEKEKKLRGVPSDMTVEKYAEQQFLSAGLGEISGPWVELRVARQDSALGRCHLSLIHSISPELFKEIVEEIETCIWLAK